MIARVSFLVSASFSTNRRAAVFHPATAIAGSGVTEAEGDESSGRNGRVQWAWREGRRARTNSGGSDTRTDRSQISQRDRANQLDVHKLSSGSAAQRLTAIKRAGSKNEPWLDACALRWLC